MKDITFDLIYKTLPQKGNLVYEYNAFRNYRLNDAKLLYKNRLYSCNLEKDEDLKELENLGIIKKDNNGNYDFTFSHLPNSEKPVFYEAGELIDFDTNELQFDLNHPVSVLPQYSYDGSVNLILNDGKNTPKLINSRFSPTARNQYQIVDRKGDADTNIYDEGFQFDIDTSLYKRTIEIPTLTLESVQYGGNLSIGNYHFYFKYADADGNETGFVAESGLVSIFIGNLPNSIRSGFRDENSHKLVIFTLENVDLAYQYVNVYYSRVTGDIQENQVTKAYKINSKFLIKDNTTCQVIVTGFEETEEITLEDLNLQYQVCGSCETQASCQNMLFLGNISKPDIPYEDLADISLRFLPYVKTENYGLNIDQNYGIKSNVFGYYDPKFIYEKTGYWYNEIYRVGIVYIMSDNTLSPVFNVRGIKDLTGDINQYTGFKLYDDDENKKRNYIRYEEDTYSIIDGSDLENVKGVFNISSEVASDSSGEIKNKIISLNFYVDDEVTTYLTDTLKIKGFFFVRQKRIPTTLCQAFMIGIDFESNTPVIPINEDNYKTESFLTQPDRLLSNDPTTRFVNCKSKLVRNQAAICPDYDVNAPYYNSLFTGSKFVIQQAVIGTSDYFTQDTTLSDRHFYNQEIQINDTPESCECKILGVEDNVKLVEIDGQKFSARAGEAEEAFRFEYIENKNKITKASNLLRGSYGPYLAIVGNENIKGLVDIMIPGYGSTDMYNYFKIRYDDKSSYYAISDRYSLDRTNYIFSTNTVTLKPSTNNEDKIKYKTFAKNIYRGDCYICQVTHRINRNFQDPSAPINDDIVDPNCWADHYEVTDGVVNKESFDEINLGDVNAVQLGMWVTFTVRSNYNLNVRTVDDSIPDEIALTGSPRGFFPYNSMSVSGNYKIPEALCYNKGFGVGLSQRWNFEVPDVPALKNDFTNRILYSDISITDAFVNGFRVFRGNHYRDYPKTYGSIIKLLEWNGNLICVFEHGVAEIAVNERAVAGEGAGGTVYINTSNVLPENPKILSDTFGSQWGESVIKTQNYIYGVDTIGKKIWRTNGQIFECISDFKVQEYLNNNITLTERELTPIIGIRNVKTHYNKFKNDVMFTFYDNLHGFEEKVWNLCWNEYLNKWVTFYSWVPSYSDNIHNEYFSFDRNTSKYIAKLGVSKSDNSFSDGIVLSENIFDYSEDVPAEIGKLSLANRNFPSGTNVKVAIKYVLERDNYGNYKKFQIRYKEKDKNNYILDYDSIKIEDRVNYEAYLYRIDEYTNYCSELFIKCKKDPLTGEWDKSTLLDDPLNNKEQNNLWNQSIINPTNWFVYKDDRGRRQTLQNRDIDYRINPSQLVWLLNIKAEVSVIYEGVTPTLLEAQAQGFANGVAVDGAQYQSTIAVTPRYNMQFLTTDFWKHGQAGIIDIADKIYPTYWYGKQHPFEFEFVVADNPDKHKIFDNLQIISNKAAPESFHYEIVGECYEFAKDKKNMYIRQEATKELYQYNGSDVTFDSNYKNLESVHRPLYIGDPDPEYYDKSTIFPLYYCRQDGINDIEDYYHLYGHKDKYTNGDKNFSALAGAEIVHYENLDEYRIWNHAKAVDIHDFKHGRIRGNMEYKEDLWDVQINPINIVQKNESKEDWQNIFKINPKDKDTYDQIPAELNLFKEYVGEQDRIISIVGGNLELPNDWTRNIVSWKDYERINKEVKIKDKFLKVRIRYSGTDLAIIAAIRTLYSISYA